MPLLVPQCHFSSLYCRVRVAGWFHSILSHSLMNLNTFKGFYEAGTKIQGLKVVFVQPLNPLPKKGISSQLSIKVRRSSAIFCSLEEFGSTCRQNLFHFFMKKGDLLSVSCLLFFISNPSLNVIYFELAYSYLDEANMPIFSIIGEPITPFKLDTLATSEGYLFCQSRLGFTLEPNRCCVHQRTSTNVSIMLDLEGAYEEWYVMGKMQKSSQLPSFDESLLYDESLVSKMCQLKEKLSK